MLFNEFNLSVTSMRNKIDDMKIKLLAICLFYSLLTTAQNKVSFIQRKRSYGLDNTWNRKMVC